jgi:hypothetical protein
MPFNKRFDTNLGGFVKLLIVRDLDNKSQKYYKEKAKSTIKEVRLYVSGEDFV